MKIAFLEYKMDLTSGGDVNFMICWAILFKDFGHTVDLLQFKEEKKYAKYGELFQVKHISQVNVDSYDIVIFNNIYIHGDEATREFIDFVYKIQTKTLYVNHDRTNPSYFFSNSHVWELMNMCDYTLGYLGSVMRNIIFDKNKIYDIEFHHFYKPFEDLHPEVELNRDKDLTFLARIMKIKGAYRFIEYAGTHHKKSPEDLIALYGYFGSIGQVELKNDWRMILEIKEKGYDKNPHPNTESSYIHLRQMIYPRQELVDTLKSSKFTWNACSFTARDKKIYDIVDNGLEAGPIEAMLYGCVPVIHDISRTAKITDDMNFEDYDCAIFTNDSMPFDELYDLIKSEQSSGTKRNNLKAFCKEVLDKQKFHDCIIGMFQKMINSGVNRKYIKSDIPLSQAVDKDNIISISKIRGNVIKNQMKQEFFDFGE